MVGWDGLSGASTLTFKQDFDASAHPCGTDAFSRLSMGKDARAGSALPHPTALTSEITLAYSEGVRMGAASRAFVAFIGTWNGVSFRVEVNLRSTNWPDAAPLDPEVVSRSVTGAGDVVLVLDAAKLPGSQGALPDMQSTDVLISWNPLLLHLVQKGLLPAPASGDWRQAQTIQVSTGMEFSTGMTMQAGTSQLRVNRFQLTGASAFALDACTQPSACDAMGRRCVSNSASPTGSAWVLDASCRNSSFDGGSSSTLPGSPGAQPRSCAVNNTAERYSCHPSLRQTRCSPDATSPSGFSWRTDAACTFTQCGSTPAERLTCHPNDPGLVCETQTLSSTGFAWRADATCMPTRCGGTNAAQKGRCHPVTAGQRCSLNSLSTTGYSWIADASCRPLEQCGGSNAAQRGQCSWDTAGRRCAANPLSPTGYEWVADASCRPLEPCGAANAAQRGQCSWDTAGRRCAANALSPTGFAWSTDASCRPIQQCGAMNPGQQGKCSPTTVRLRCVAHLLSPTGFAWAEDLSCVPAWRLVQSCQPNQCQPRACTTPSDPEGLSCSQLGQICNTPGGGRAYLCGYP